MAIVMVPNSKALMPSVLKVNKGKNMESEYLLEITDDGFSVRYRDEAAHENAEAASRRLHKKCVEGRPFVSVFIKNPRHPSNK